MPLDFVVFMLFFRHWSGTANYAMMQGMNFKNLFSRPHNDKQVEVVIDLRGIMTDAQFNAYANAATQAIYRATGDLLRDRPEVALIDGGICWQGEKRVPPKANRAQIVLSYLLEDVHKGMRDELVHRTLAMYIQHALNGIADHCPDAVANVAVRAAQLER